MAKFEAIGLATLLAAAIVPGWSREAAAADGGAISGAVKDPEGAPVKALVVIQCTCLQKERTGHTNDDGLYAFRDLPPGIYTVEFFAGASRRTEQVQLAAGQKRRVVAELDPTDKREIVVTPSVRSDARGGITLSRSELDKLPLGGEQRNPAEAAIDIAPTGDRDAGGMRLAGRSSAELDYTLDGSRATNPTTGMPAIATVQEFVDSVEVVASGYSAEYGGTSGGGVHVRRMSGSNKFRGQSRFTYTPRLGRPRYTVRTDNAVRALEVPDYNMQGIVAAAGPIKEDRLFWSAGIQVAGGQSTLVQSFHFREDKNGSGGFEQCPYEQGAGDCVEGGDYISTRKFAEQSFKTGGTSLNGFLGLDWSINPRHRLELTVRGSPTFIRRSYRRPVNFSSLDPDSLGANPNADPISGASTVANGVVDDAFGWDASHAFQTVLVYKGRVADDKLEIDGHFGFLQTGYDEAWRLDNPSLKRQTSTSLNDGQGASLFELLDDEARLDLAPGVKEACNDPDLPGLVCPVRNWATGGIGRYFEDRSRRAEGKLALTHFFNGAGSHQLKYGAQMEHLERHRVLRFSGQNDPDFYDNCAGVGGGEWCHDGAGYDVQTGNRVDNHRMVFISADRPNDRQTIGYGRVRHEDNELRAITDALGRGARVPKHDEKVSTQNYAMFLQDRWGPRPELQLEAGVRWEIQDMRDVRGERALLIWDNVAPRLSASYDWTQQGQSRLYGSYGWFYQNLPLALINRTHGGEVMVFRSFERQNCEGNSVTVAGRERPLWKDGQPTEWCVDASGGPGGTTGTRPGAVVPRLKGQYDQQWEVGYEHEIIEDLILGVSWLHRDLRRGVEDVSTNDGLDFIVANPGVPVDDRDVAAQEAACSRLQQQLDEVDANDADTTEVARELDHCRFLAQAYAEVGSLFARPTRSFDAYSFTIRKRLAKNWLLTASYTYSREVGNYDGYVDPITGAVNIGSSSQYDLPELVRNSFGPLSGSIPHRVKIDGAYTFDMRKAGYLTLGASVRFSSGRPVSMRAAHTRYQGVFPVYILSRGNAGRLAPTHRVNLSVQYTYPIKDRYVLGVGARLLNATNARGVLRVDDVYTYQTTRPIAGGDGADLKHAKIRSPGNPTEFFQRQIVDPQGNYGAELAFQSPIAAQLDVLLFF